MTSRKEDPCQTLIADLLRSGLLGAGDTLSVVGHPELQAEVLPDGRLLLNAWPRPMGLRPATAKAFGIAEYGLLMRDPKVRARNPLTFWTYLDRHTGKDERLSKLRDLRISPNAETTASLGICIQAPTAEIQGEPQSDA